MPGDLFEDIAFKNMLPRAKGSALLGVDKVGIAIGHGHLTSKGRK
jgi:hypothetical protein